MTAKELIKALKEVAKSAPEGLDTKVVMYDTGVQVFTDIGKAVRAPDFYRTSDIVLSWAACQQPH